MSFRDDLAKLFNNDYFVAECCAYYVEKHAGKYIARTSEIVSDKDTLDKILSVLECLPSLESDECYILDDSQDLNKIITKVLKNAKPPFSYDLLMVYIDNSEKANQAFKKIGSYHDEHRIETPEFFIYSYFGDDNGLEGMYLACMLNAYALPVVYTFLKKAEELYNFNVYSVLSTEYTLSDKSAKRLFALAYDISVLTRNDFSTLANDVYNALYQPMDEYYIHQCDTNDNPQNAKANEAKQKDLMIYALFKVRDILRNSKYYNLEDSDNFSNLQTVREVSEFFN